MNQYIRNFSNLIVYQIYPRSFCDSNGDGIGDIQGIISKIDYIAELGINAVWLSPFFKSPDVDFGYDVADYRDVDPKFGTLTDFKEMLDKFHEKGIKVIVDLVANHTSDQHYWFQEARKSKDNPYRDYYYWAEKPLNDWQSCFGGSVWQKDERTGEYYLHSYAIEQPDLNWENPRVRKEIKAIVEYWVDMGVDGFRCDVLDQIAKDFENDKDRSGPQLHAYVKELFGDKELENVYTVGECWSVDLDRYKYLCAVNKKALKSCFNFKHFSVHRFNRYTPKAYTLDQVMEIIYAWERETEGKLLYPLVWENHDQPRVVSRNGDDKKYRYESATMLATFLYLQNGIPFIYEGQEYGAKNQNYPDISWFRDIEGINYYNENKDSVDEKTLIDGLNFGGRDNPRRPMAWNSSKDGGFGSDNPWLPFAQDMQEINVEKDLASDKSIIKYYRELLTLRKENKQFTVGKLKVLANNPNYTAYIKSYGGKKYLVICNFKEETTIGDLKVKIKKIVLSNYDRRVLPTTFMPYECIVCELI